MEEKYFKMLINSLKKAKKTKEVPVSAIIVKNNKKIAKASNSRIRNHNPLMHAEIKCIIKASKKIKDWRLEDCELYVTLEPCHMCKEIIKECRIKNVNYLINSNKTINYKTNFAKSDSLYAEEYKKMLITFFKNLR